jgi:LuxR family transcriptional regulator, maltose regulon positive regulatory protein
MDEMQLNRNNRFMPALLQTKIQLPPLRSGHVARERIMFQIGAESMARLVLVSAPAGFGKSSALIQWAHGLREKGTLVVWYALDERDNDPARFVAYLLGAFRGQDMAFASLPDRKEQVNLQDAVDLILNGAIAVDAPTLLILDDYHLISESRIHDAIGGMIDHMPPNIRLAIGTRADPPLQLARLRVRSEIAEIRMRDLRFTSTEMRDWLSVSLGWHPAHDTIAELGKTTEGWAAALALILMVQSHTDDAGLRQQLARFSQSRRHLFDYFAQEILDQQPDRIRDFLLDTCVLNRLESDLCQAMTGQSDAPLLLNQLAVQSLFVIPLSDTEPIYRYHHLFADFLRQYLEMQDGVRYLHQHRRAASWFADKEQVVDAVHHALAGGDYNHAATLIIDRAWEALTARGEITTVVYWLGRFPDEQLMKHPRLCLYFSRALYLTGDMDQSQHYVQIASEVFAADAADHPALQAIAYGYQATLAAYRGDVQSGLKWIEQANTLRHNVDGVDRVRIANTDAFLRYRTGSIPAARKAYMHALSLAEAINHNFLTLDAHFYLAQVDLLAGDLQAVADRCQALLAQYKNRIAPLSAIMLPLARVQYQRNQIAEAEATLHEGIKLASRANLPDILWLAYVNLAKVLSISRLEEAETMLRQARHIAYDFHSPIMESIIGAAEARLMLRTGQDHSAREWASHFELVPYHQQQFESTVQVRILLQQGQHDMARETLLRLIAESHENGRRWYVIVGNILLALTYRASGDSPAALKSLEYALTLTEPHGFIRIFLDEGKPMLDLLREVAKQDAVGDYATHLLEVAASEERTQHPADLLTDREIEVLSHIATGASNNDIAERLVLSVGTVKSHIHHIMGKLDAQNRTEAVSKARSLNILPH